MPVQLRKTAIDEVVKARRDLQGGARGRPTNAPDGTAEGAAINKACVVLLTASLQTYVEEVFLECSFKCFTRRLAGNELSRYQKTWSRWGNPSDDNIISLFRRIGCDDVLADLGWQGITNKVLRSKLNQLNQIRNDIAHGSDLAINGSSFSLTLAKFNAWYRSVDQFSQRFETHALRKFA